MRLLYLSVCQSDFLCLMDVEMQLQFFHLQHQSLHNCYSAHLIREGGLQEQAVFTILLFWISVNKCSVKESTYLFKSPNVSFTRSSSIILH